jgi:outer membrane protein insertion porin family
MAIASLWPGVAMSSNSWTIDPELMISADESERLHTRTPEIKNPGDLQQILVSIALRHPFSSLWIERMPDGLVVKGTRGVALSKVDFEMAPLSLLIYLRAAATPYLGQVHSEELREKLEIELKSVLSKHGYMSSNITTSVRKAEGDVQYRFKLDIGDPCIVRGFKWEQSPPVSVDQSIRPGEICSAEEAGKAISETESKARSLGFANTNLTFEGFEFDAGTASAWIKVKGMFGKKIVYEFVDQNTGRSLSSIFSNADMQNFDPAILSPDSVNFELLRQLKIKGYSNAQVSGPVLTETGSGELIHKFNVIPGEVTIISRLQVEGNNYFNETEIFSLLGIERPPQSEGQRSGVIFNPDAIAAGIERIRNSYINRGFWNVKVIDRQIQSQAGSGLSNTIVIVVSIDEGDQFIFDRIAVSGNSAIPNEEIIELSNFEKSAPLDRTKIVEFQQKIRSLYANNGYFYTSTSAETSSKSLSNGRMETIVIVKIDEGPRVKFGDVFVTGLVKTQPKVVLRELHFKTGDWYTPEQVSSSRDALLRIGTFSTVIIKPLDPDLAFKRSDTVDLVIQVTESPSRTLTFGPGWSSYYGMRYNVEAALTNILGTGRQLYGRAEFKQESHQKAIGSKTLVGRSISAGYLEPHLLDSNIDGTISVAQGARATEYAWSLTRAGELELSHSLRSVLPGSKISTFYGRKLNEEEGVKEDVDAFLADTFAVGRAGVRLFVDKRNDLLWASAGYTLNSELSWARYDLGGDLRYFRWELTNNHYVSPVENLVFAFGISITSFEDVEREGTADADILPQSERLLASGVERVRGFDEKVLGPIVRRPTLDPEGNWACGYTSSPTGGSRRLVLKLESRYRFTSAFATTLFVDSGTASFNKIEEQKFKRAFERDVKKGCGGEAISSIEDNIGYDVSDVISEPEVVWQKNYTSAGTALNFLTPIGAINLAYGVPWHEPKTAKCKSNKEFCYPRSDLSVPLWRRGEFHINVGAKF